MLSTAVAIMVAQATTQTIPAGAALVNIEISGSKLEVFTYKPAKFDGKRMIFVFHGVLRNADVYRDHSIEMGDKFNALIIAPKFDNERFPSRRYQFGGILDAEGKANKPEDWTYAYIPKLAAEVKARENAPGMKYWMIGHSAGGQFVARMSAFQDTGAEWMVAANPGSHLFPTRNARFGYGFGGLPPELSSDDQLKRYLAAPLTLYLGTADNKPDDNFDQSELAMAQGGGRFQRGLGCYAAGKAFAEAKGWTFNWRLALAPDVAHDHEKMFNHENCELALFGK